MMLKIIFMKALLEGVQVEFAVCDRPPEHHQLKSSAKQVALATDVLHRVVVVIE